MSETVVYQVSDFIAVTNQILDGAYPSVVIEGEVASFKVNQGKFVFFDLKDETGSIGCFMSLFSLRVPIEDGMTVTVVAKAKLTPWGKFSLTVKSIRPKGEGSLKKSFELLRTKLEREGLFDESRKRPLPFMPERIAVIGSTQSAGYADFIKIISGRWSNVAVEVAHVQVQGEQSPAQIVSALRYINTQSEPADVVVILRGGGSADDLAGFNDERLVRAIAASRIPTVVGVGHETDTTLADMAADRRAATPSDAARIVVPDARELGNAISRRLGELGPRLTRSIDGRVELLQLQLDDAAKTSLRRADDQLALLATKKRLLDELDPRAALRRGYAIIRGVPAVGQTMTISTSKHVITAEVTDVAAI